MKIILGADHGGFKLKEEVKEWLIEQDYQVEDCGAFDFDSEDDYPDFAFTVADKVAQQSDAVGILFCRSGGGMSIAANKVKGIRAVDIFDLTSALHAKLDNNANIISVGADWMNPAETKFIIQRFLETEFKAEERHVRRIRKVDEREG